VRGNRLQRICAGRSCSPSTSKGRYLCEVLIVLQNCKLKVVILEYAATFNCPLLLVCVRFHLYVVGTEECERSIAQSAVNTSKKAWEAHLTEILGPMYVPLRSHTLQVRTEVLWNFGICHYVRYWHNSDTSSMYRRLFTSWLSHILA
jgi:hypothetical protein